MRITGGELVRRVVAAPRGGDVRPTQDRVREALFSMLAADIVGAAFIDLYAGSGVVGLEALSRGAGRVIWVEGSRAVSRTTRSNIEDLAGEGQTLIVDEAEKWLRRGGKDLNFDILFADPPYGESREKGLAGLARSVIENSVVRPGGLLIAEMPLSPFDPWPGWRVVRDRRYGKTRLIIGCREN